MSNQPTFSPDKLDERINEIFTGRVVRKDLVQRVKKGTNIPTFVLEFLLARYCATDDPDEIEAGLEAVQETIQGNFVRPNESNAAQSLVQQKGRHKFIDKVHVTHKEKEKRHWAEMENFGSKRIAVNESHYRDNSRLLEGGLWCEAVIGYNDIEDDDYAFYVDELRPIQISRFGFEDFCEGRRQFSRDEWIDVVLRSIGLEPSQMDTRLKFHFLSRLAPFVEQNYNLIELGPRGTGKSYAFSEFSPYSTLISGGQTTTATLFYNKARRQVGIIGYWDVIAFDEVAGIRIKDPGTIQILKDYMANGRFSLGTEVMGPASLAFVGNIDDSIEQIVASTKFDLFKPLPKEFDLAVIHRFHNYIPGWEIPANSNELLTGHYGFITDYLAEAFHHLSKKVNLYSAVKKRVKLGPGFQGRDETAVYKTVSAFIKLLHPDGECSDAEFHEYVAYAIEARRRIKEQLNKRKTDDEFAEIQLSYLDSSGNRVEVDCPESKGVDATLNPKRGTLEGEEPEDEQAGSKPLPEAGQKPGASATTSPTEPPRPAALEEKHFTIRYGDKGYSYRSLFGDYLVGAKKLRVEDPYVRKDYQIRNFVALCELVVDTGSIKELELVTALEHETHRRDVESKLNALRESLADNGVEFSFSFNQELHDREIVTDTGWHISIGRGLDIYQPVDGWISVGAGNQDLRPCKETKIGIFRSAKTEKATGSNDSVPVAVPTERPIDEIVKEGEGSTIEFKSTLRTNLHTDKPDKKIELAVLKTIAAFLNSKGGTLLIGVDDEGKALGLEADKFKSEDKMNLHLVNIIKDRIGAEHMLNVSPRFVDYDGHRVLRVDCEPANFPSYVRDGNDEIFFIRAGAATSDLSVSKVQAYVAQRFQ